MRSFPRTRRLSSCSLLATVALSACGGGGGIVSTPPPPTTTLSVAPTSLSCTVGQTVALGATLSPSSATATFTFTPSNTSVSVTATGPSANVACNTAGTSSIQVTAGGQTVTVPVTIAPQPVTVLLNFSPTELSLLVGATQRITTTVTTTPPGGNTAVKFTSSAPQIATVDTLGNVTGVSAGTARINVASVLLPTVNVDVPVTVVAAGSLSLSTHAVTLTPGTAQQILATLLSTTSGPLGGATVTFVSRNPAVAAVTPASGTTGAAGTVQATITGGNTPGTAYVVATAGGKADSVLVTLATSAAPVVTTLAATNVAATSAVVQGNVAQDGKPYTMWFEWGTSPTLATSSSSNPSNGPPAACPGTAVCTWSLTLSSLTSGTTYFYRAVANNAVGTTRGAIMSFTTLGAAATAPTLSNLTVTLTTLNDATCTNTGSSFAYSFSYSDPNGDVSTSAPALTIAFAFAPSGTTGSFAAHPTVTGNGTSGTMSGSLCTVFGTNTSATQSFTLSDAAGNASNTLSFTVQKPAGANVVAGVRAQSSAGPQPSPRSRQ
ncbi:Ig domain protein group 2 domain protein (plasmid) [Gemmatirosa kalamazoonensis]|uniref:Ig domain protein group 2 domain protein n=1 Tax=Gemmatirosa kalamazoonensis TaxID=861299 RepID=W0RST3_9BACT|nr:Ig-like domain-containing protein [Gemmatirosa kalamazoonensis]AHG93731.1 Ig domain protein group 2 domain protein [Gemmatirosa kalamazoonensis]